MLENNINTNSCTSTTTDCCFVECTTTTTIACLNPIDQLFEIATNVSEVNSLTKFEGLLDVINNAFVLNSCGTCCPDCTYVFTSKETYNKFLEALFGGPTTANASTSNISEQVCCVNVYGNYIIPPEGEEYSTACCNNFTECAESIFQYFSENSCETEPSLLISDLLTLYLVLIDVGIVEQGSINGESQVCRIFENMKDYFGNTCFIEDFINTLDTGIVIDCRDGRMIIASVETYLKFIEI